MTLASHYLIFDLNQCRYGVATSAVQEIFFLPALIPVAEAPPDIVGILNLRGEILPVIDLNRRFGRPSRPYQLTDSVIVLQTDKNRAGIMVDRVYDVEEIQHDRQPIDLTYGRGETATKHHFVLDLVEVGEHIVTLLDATQMLRYADRLDTTAAARRDRGQPDPDPLGNGISDTPDSSETAGSLPPPRDTILPERRYANTSALSPIPGFAEVSTNVWQIFQQRANSLRSQTAQDSKAGLQPLAVVNLQGELFGIGLDTIHEFTDIHSITPIPCCPNHILGNLNLRGEVVTLIDISHTLNLATNGVPKNKAMLIHLDQLVAGVAVDDVLDVVYVNPRDIQPIPAALHTGHDEFLEGIAPYYDQSMGVLDLPKVFVKGNLVVDEEA